MIRIADYPQLRQLCWNRPADAEIEDAAALAIYEDGWRHVDASTLTPEERDLIERLKAEFGNGVFLGR